METTGHWNCWVVERQHCFPLCTCWQVRSPLSAWHRLTQIQSKLLSQPARASQHQPADNMKDYFRNQHLASGNLVWCPLVNNWRVGRDCSLSFNCLTLLCSCLCFFSHSFCLVWSPPSLYRSLFLPLFTTVALSNEDSDFKPANTSRATWEQQRFCRWFGQYISPAIRARNDLSSVWVPVWLTFRMNPRSTQCHWCALWEESRERGMVGQSPLSHLISDILKWFNFRIFST